MTLMKKQKRMIEQGRLATKNFAEMHFVVWPPLPTVWNLGKGTCLVRK